MQQFKTWLINVPNIPNRLMALYLRKRGWVAFYLDKEYRTCNGDSCWLRLYEDGEASNLRTAEHRDLAIAMADDDPLGGSPKE